MENLCSLSNASQYFHCGKSALGFFAENKISLLVRHLKKEGGRKNKGSAEQQEEKVFLTIEN